MKKDERKSRTTKLRLIEFSIWLVIFLILGGLVALGVNSYHETYESHNIYMPDVDGLIVGSPVYMMGVNIGHITKIKIIGEDEIRVRFKVLDRDIHIPQGTIATVDFSGLGGSKSLVLYPPDSDRDVPPERLTNNTDYIMVERPRRLRDSYVLLYEMYNTIMDMIYTVSAFANDIKFVELPDNNNNDSIDDSDLQTFLKFYNGILDSSMDNMKRLRSAIERE